MVSSFNPFISRCEDASIHQSFIGLYIFYHNKFSKSISSFGITRIVRVANEVGPSTDAFEADTIAMQHERLQTYLKMINTEASQSVIALYGCDSIQKSVSTPD